MKTAHCLLFLLRFMDLFETQRDRRQKEDKETDTGKEKERERARSRPWFTLQMPATTELQIPTTAELCQGQSQDLGAPCGLLSSDGDPTA